MAAFAAPSYSRESNTAWLNDLIGDIISPSSRAQSRVSSRADGEHTLAPRVDGENPSILNQQSSHEQEYEGPARSRSRKSSIYRGSLRSPVFNTASHYSYRSSSSRAESLYNSSSARDMMFGSVSGDDDLQSLGHTGRQSQSSGLASCREFEGGIRDSSGSEWTLQAYIDDVDTDASALRNSVSSVRGLLPRASSLQFKRDWPLRSGQPLPLTGDNRTGSTTPYQSHQVSALPGNNRAASSMDDEALSRSNAPSRTSLGRSYSQKYLADLQKPPLARIQSNVTEEFDGFQPHPAVRPFSMHTALGEAAAPTEHEDHVYPGPFALTLIIVGICLSVFIISVDRNIVTTAIPQITEAFRSYDDIGWYGSAYFLTASAFQPLYGRIYMSFDTRWTFLVALAVFELGSVLGGVSPNSEILILGRAVQGFGSAGILTGSFVVGTHSVPLRGRPVLFAFVGVLYGVGALAGPLLGGVFTDLLSWRWAFWINLPVGAVTFVAVFFFFKPRKHRNTTERQTWITRVLQLDLIGNIILLGACTMLFLALQMSEASGSWSSVPVIGLLCGFGSSVVVFIAWLLYRGDKALIPPRIVRQRTVAASCGAAFFIYGGLLIHAYYLPIWFQAIQGDSAIHSGVNMIPYMLANALFSLMAGIFVSKNGLFAPPAILGTAIGTVGCGLLATIDQNTNTSTWIGFEILISAGLGMAIQQGFSAVQTALPLDEVPIGTAAVVASQSLGGAIFVSIGNTILQDHLLNKDADQAIPGVDVRAVFRLGATVFRSFVPAEALPALVELYNDSLQGVFIASVPLIGCAFLCSLCMEWRSVKAKQELARRKPETEKA